MRYDITGSTLLAKLITSAALALVPSTLGAQAPSGERKFPEHDPGRCAVAARVIDGVNRHEHRDTTVFTPGRDTLFTATTASLRECEAAFAGRAIDDRELLDLMRVQLLTAQDEAALASARRHLGKMASRPPEDWGWELYLIVSDHLAGKPARVEQARQFLAELDALGEPAASVRVLAHRAMLKVAIQHHDDEMMRREAAAVVKAWRELDDKTRLWRANALASTFVDQASVEVLARGGDAARAVIDTALGLVPRDAALARRLLQYAQTLYGNIDKPAAPLDAQFWYNTGPAGTTRPAPGRVSLILPISRPCAGACLDTLAGARRIEERFRGEDLDITFRRKTAGYYLDIAPVTPFAEAQYDSTYLLHEVGLPGALAIAVPQFRFQADGRRVDEPTVDDLNYPGAGVIVVDRAGVIRYVAREWDLVLESRIADLIERLLRDQAEPRPVP